MTTKTTAARDNTLRHLTTSVIYTIVSVLFFGVIYPVVIWGIGTVLFHHQAAGSLVVDGKGAVIGSELVGQNCDEGRSIFTAVPRPRAKVTIRRRPAARTSARPARS